MSNTPTKPYLLRAIFDWCVDNGQTPYVAVRVDAHTRVPMAYVRDGQIVLNIAPYATHQLSITNEDISCQARFNGVAQQLYVPMGNVIAIYSRETGQGMAFEAGIRSGSAMELGGLEEAEDESAESGQEEATPDSPVDRGEEAGKPKTPPASRPSHLKIIK